MNTHDEYHSLRQKLLTPCPSCGSSDVDFHVPEKGALGIYCNDCEWSLDPYET